MLVKFDSPFCTTCVSKGAFTRSVFQTLFVRGTFDLFNDMYKQHHRNALNPFLNGSNNRLKTLRVNISLGMCTLSNSDSYSASDSDMDSIHSSIIRIGHFIWIGIEQCDCTVTNDLLLQLVVPWNEQHRSEQLNQVAVAMAYIHTSSLSAISVQHCHQMIVPTFFTPLTFQQFVYIFKLISSYISKREKVSSSCTSFVHYFHIPEIMTNITLLMRYLNYDVIGWNWKIFNMLSTSDGSTQYNKWLEERNFRPGT